MGKTKELSEVVRGQIIVLAQQSKSSREISKIVKVSQSCVVKTIARWKASGTFSSRERCGRPKKTTERLARRIKFIIEKNPKLSSYGIKDELGTSSEPLLSARSIRRVLQLDLKRPARRPAKKPTLNDKQRKNRLAFCTKYEHWNEKDWERLMFSDESTFQQFGVSCNYVRRQEGQRYVQKYTVPTMKHPPSVMVWGCFSARFRGRLHFMPKGKTINSQVYMGILKEKLLPSMGSHRTTIFQQDNAPCHTSKAMQAFFKKNKVSVLDWPGNSPDLNPIENLWTIMKRKVRSKVPHSIEDLQKKLIEVWAKDITPELCQKLVHSMPRRIAAVLKNHGYHTKY